MSPVEPLIRWDGISKRFGPKTLFSSVAGSVGRGEVFAILGPNGSGKSTFLKILAGLLRPSSGRISWHRDGECPSRRGIGFASPELRLYGELTGRENLEFFAALGGHSGKPDTLGRRLEAVGLAAADHDKLASRYSSGMLQRLRLAFALASEPDVLFLDEPGSNLDEAGRAVVDRVVAEQRERGSVVLATNDPREAALAERNLRLG